MAEIRLIDANALPRKTVILRRRSYLDGRKYVSENRHAVLAEDIDRAPTIDAVPVVRCRECMHCLWDEHPGKPGRCMEHHGWCDPDGFCHKGEKWEGGASDA